jgi:hypothetical protein
MEVRSMVKKIAMVIVTVSLLALSLSCSPSSSPSSSSRNTQDGASGRTVEIRPLNYRFREDEDGWNIGFVRMYLINTSKSALSSFDLTLQSASVETVEGKTYPVELFSFYRGDVEKYVGDAYVYEGGIKELRWPQQVRVGNEFPLVPGFPIIPLTENGAHYVFIFRFAKAANPTKMELSTSNGSISFDLADVERTLPSPNPTSESLADFANLLNQDDESIRFTLEDNCTYDSNWKFSIAYTLTNKDKFDETHFTIPGGYAVYYADGSTSNWPDRSIVDETVGPDQTIHGTFDFSQFAGLELNALYLIYYENGTSTRVYKVSCSEQ